MVRGPAGGPFTGRGSAMLVGGGLRGPHRPSGVVGPRSDARGEFAGHCGRKTILALSRVVPEFHRIEGNPRRSVGIQHHLVKQGTRVIVEFRNYQLQSKMPASAVRQVRGMARGGGSGLLIMHAERPAGAVIEVESDPETKVVVAVWRNEDDDHNLEDALRRLSG
jgi:hypothetical protein